MFPPAKIPTTFPVRSQCKVVVSDPETRTAASTREIQSDRPKQSSPRGDTRSCCGYISYSQEQKQPAARLRRSGCGTVSVLLTANGLAASSAKLAENLVVCWKAVRLMFRVNQRSVHHDVKDSAAAFDQFCFDTCCFSNCVRQTGGLRGVVSLHAVGNADFHTELLCCQKWVRSCSNPEHESAFSRCCRSVSRQRRIVCGSV